MNAFMRYTPLKKLSPNSQKNFVVNFMNVKDKQRNEQTYEQMNGKANNQENQL